MHKITYLSVYGPLVEEVKDLLLTTEEFSVSWVRRSANGVAHLLAKESCGTELHKTWFHIPPVCIMDALNSKLAENSDKCNTSN